ncbi:hypothetical protein PVAND_012596 [Polypedilum vanderplanki]|nr:hypothetical protein PVAND_012596 [Polypedilum vanderplanki]
MLTDASENLYQEIYQCGWENLKDNKLRKDLVLILVRSRRIVELKVLNIWGINIEQFFNSRITEGNAFGSKNYIDESENILILGDFNHELKLGSLLESFMLQSFHTRLFSPRESTTNARTVIDGVFGRIDDYNIEVFIYESYSSHHKPLVIRVHEL